MQEVSQRRFEESYGFAVLLCYSETNGLRATATPTSVPSVNFANYNVYQRLRQLSLSPWLLMQAGVTSGA